MSSDPRTEDPPSIAASPPDVDRNGARYLFAISVLSDPGGDRVTNDELREYLDVTPASVTGMVSRLDDRGLVDHEKYRGVTLTDRGEALATRAGWRFCVVSTFFESVLDATLDDETAFDIGFVLPTSGVFRLRERVDSACLGLCPEPNDDAGRCTA